MQNTKIFKIDDISLKYAKNLILNKELVAFPTETVYGLGGLATSDTAIKKIFTAKGRPSDNPLIVHVHKDFNIESLVYVEQNYVEKLKQTFWPGPLTMIFKSKGVVSSYVSAGLNTLAIRVPEHEECQKFLKYLNLPIAAPSANVSKHTSPVTSEHVFNDLNGKIPLILEGGKSQGGIESTVLDVTGDTPIILRRGLITLEMIKNIVGNCGYSDSSSGKVRSPGVKYTHYSPKCQTALFAKNQVEEAQILYNEYLINGKKPYFLCDNSYLNLLSGNMELLGGTPEEIASNLYDKLLYLEKVADIIIAFEVNTGNELDLSIMNRLSKACGSK